MKKLFLFSVAALAFCACSSDEVVSENNVANQQPKEISFFALNKGATRAAIDGTTFPTDLHMNVSALDLTNHREFFTPTEFAKGTTYWEGTTKRYWPLSPVQINFLAIANQNVSAANDVTWTTTGTASSEAQSVQVVMANNYAASTAQKDFMFAVGNGQVTKNGNTLSFPTKVDMEFKHTQAYLVFKLKAADNASTAITITNVELKNVYTQGTATIARQTPGTYADANTDLTWNRTAGATAAATYRSVTTTQAAISQALTTSLVETGHLMVVPNMTAADTYADNGTTMLKISYTLDSKDYTLEYELDNDIYKAGYKYVYNITFKLHEIVIDPKVTDWDTDTNDDDTDNDAVNIFIPGIAYNESSATVSIGNTAGTYTFDISNVPAAGGGSSYSIVEGSTGTDFVDTVNMNDNGDGSITVTVKSIGGADNATRDLKLKLGESEKMTITLKLSNTPVDA